MKKTARRLRRKVLSVLMSVALIMAMMPAEFVLADDDYVCEVNGVPKTSFPSSFDTNNMTVKLLQDVSTTMRKANSTFTKNVTIDLNGYDLTVTNVGEDYPAIYICRSGSNFTITGPGSIIAPDASSVVGITKSNSTVTIGQGVKLIGDTGILLSDGAKSATVNFDGEIDADTYGVYVNGQLTDESAAPTMNIGGTIESDAYGIYGAGCAVWNVSGDITAGTTGIEIRAGELNVKDGASIESTATTFSTAPNGNGTSVMGAGIAVSQHTTKKPIAVNIEGGTISGPVALYQNDVQGNGAAATELITMDVSGGSFEGTLEDNAVDVTNVTNFISGGSFNENVPATYLAEGCATTENSGSFEVVVEYVAKIGNNYYETLTEAVAAADPGDTIDIINDFEIAAPIMVGKELTINGNGHTIDCKANRGIRVNADDVELTVKNLTMTSSNKACERAVQVDSGKMNPTITIDNCDLYSTTYTVNICGGVEDLVLNIKDSTITGWGAVNCWGVNGDVTITDSTLIGINDKSYNADGWNDFGVIVLEGDTTGATTEHSEAYNVVLVNTIVDARSTTGNKQAAVLFNEPSTVNEVTVTGDSEFVYDNEDLAWTNGEDNELKIESGTFSSDPSEYTVKGYTGAPNGDGTYGVVAGVAKIDSTVYDTLAEAVAAANAGDTIIMIDDVELDAAQVVDKEVTIDLNGCTISGNNISRVIDITPAGDLTIEDSDGDGKITIPQTNISTRSETIGNHGSLTVNGGTIENNDTWAGGGSYAIRSENKVNNSDATTPGDTVTINGGNILCPGGYGFAMFQGDSFTMTDGNVNSLYGIANNGTSGEATTMDISGGTITSTDPEGTAVYHPGIGTLNITGGTITGATGVEIRAGTLNMTGGTIVGTGEGLSSEPNNNGTTTVGAGIAVVQHTTKQPIEVNISDGEIEACVALYEANVQHNSAADIAKISFDVSGGTFTSTDTSTGAAIATEDMSGFVRGGTFNTPVDEEDCAPGFVPEDNGDGTYGVEPDEGLMIVDPYKGDKSEENWTYPTEDGKIFAGWYTDETCTTPYTETTGVAYPKFVDAQVMKTRAQLKVGEAGEKDSIRFVSQVDKLDYLESGFVIKNNNNNSEALLSVSKIFGSLKVDGGRKLPTDYAEDAIGFAILNLNGIPATGLDITATAYWVTADGTTVRGATGPHITSEMIDEVKQHL